MPIFLDPFSGLAPERALTKRELTRALRMALSAEEEAVCLYEALADATEDKVAKAVLQDVASEERVHAGEFQRVLGLLLDDEDARMEEGADEVDELNRRLATHEPADTRGSGDPPAIGNIKGETSHE